MKKSRFGLFLCLMMAACQSQKKTAAECDELSMHAYRGWPKAAKQLETDCQGVIYKYTKEHCQKALGLMIIGTNEHELTKLMGDQVMKCFNEIDKQRFLKPMPKSTGAKALELVHPAENKSGSGHDHDPHHQQ